MFQAPSYCLDHFGLPLHLSLPSPIRWIKLSGAQFATEEAIKAWGGGSANIASVGHVFPQQALCWALGTEEKSHQVPAHMGSSSALSDPRLGALSRRGLGQTLRLIPASRPGREDLKRFWKIRARPPAFPKPTTSSIRRTQGACEA